ncbi:MAG: OB-fold nucleic acid binding domain-containing protein, partial [Candidatus Eremiobacteraeota bacterium]|nr:OB-fold nucleic acid binding domain-containing protein [Candidatus Eremiobacteraeota bacterium]
MNLNELAGIGKESVARFAELGVSDAQALLDYLPHRYEDLRFPTPISELGAGESEENVVGRILSVRERRARIAIVEAELDDGTGRVTAKWFGRKYLIGALKKDMRLFVRGRVTRTLAGVSLNVGSHKVLAEDETYSGEMVPVYPASKTLTSRKIHQVVARNMQKLLTLVHDDLPPTIAKQFRFPSARDAYISMHAPASPESALRARERFIFTEFLALALAACLKRAKRETQERATAMKIPAGLLSEFAAALPYAMTNAQSRVTDEIWQDMTRESPMNRLLQGDVGSGKTLVAAAAIVMAARNGMQSALMAPTEILASQHASKLAPLLLPFGITVEAVFGSQGARARTQA